MRESDDGGSFAVDDEFWVHWFGEKLGRLIGRAAFRVSRPEDALACVYLAPPNVAGAIAFRVSRDRADGLYLQPEMIAVRGDVPGDFAIRFLSDLQARAASWAGRDIGSGRAVV